MSRATCRLPLLPARSQISCRAVSHLPASSVEQLSRSPRNKIGALRGGHWKSRWIGFAVHCDFSRGRSPSLETEFATSFCRRSHSRRSQVKSTDQPEATARNDGPANRNTYTPASCESHDPPAVSAA